MPGLNKYTPDPEKFAYYADYVLENPCGKRTYEGYLAYKMKGMISQEKEEEAKRKCGTKS